MGGSGRRCRARQPPPRRRTGSRYRGGRSCQGRRKGYPSPPSHSVANPPRQPARRRRAAVRLPAAEKGPAPVVKWEYKVLVSIPTRDKPNPNLEGVLNRLGAEGWELVGFSSAPRFQVGQGDVVVLAQGGGHPQCRRP
jgi:Domain of unknown function (DUF4177)